MAGSDPWKRYLDTGMELTNLTRDRAEKIVKEFVKAGEVQREHAQQRVDDLLERSRKASTVLAETVRVEVTRQLSELGLISAKPKKKAATTASATTALSTPAQSTAGGKNAGAAKPAPGAAKATVKAANKTVGAAKPTVKAANKTVGAANKTAGAVKPTVGAANKSVGAAKSTVGAANKTAGAVKPTAGATKKRAMGGQS